MVLGLLLLAGCATPAPEVEPEATETPRPTSTPTPVVLEVPLARIPGDCAALLPLGDFAVLGAGWELARDGSRAPQTVLQTSRRQSGTTDCSWTGPGGATLAFLIVPDARTDELNYSIRHLLDDGVQYDPFGSDSLLVCDATGCDFSALVGEDFWFAGRAEAGDPTAVSAVLAAVRARAAGALIQPNLRWENPPAVHPGWGRTCGARGLVEGIARLAADPRLEEADVHFADHD